MTALLAFPRHNIDVPLGLAALAVIVAASLLWIAYEVRHAIDGGDA